MLKLKKVVVVVDTNHKEFFRDVEVLRLNYEALKLGTELSSPDVLVLRQGKKTIGIFKKWLYWRQIEG